MYGYKIKIDSLPKIIWATETRVLNYYFKNKNTDGTLEISYRTFDSLTQVINGKRQTIFNNSLNCIAGSEPRQSFGEPECAVNVISIAVKIENFTVISEPIEPKDFESTEYLLLPSSLNNISAQNEGELITLMHKIIRFNAYKTESNKMLLNSLYFELLYKIDALMREQNEYKAVKHYDYYINKANAIIEERCTEKLTLSDVAAELNISPVYLSAIYKKQTGISFKEQVLRAKMKKADTLLIDRNIPTTKVAAILGFCDENYFRKKFKEYFGMNVGEYRKIKSGLTLLHKKPILKNYQSES